MRNALLSVKTALDTAFYGGGLVLALLLFFVVYDNDVFGGHWVLFCLYASINLMWMLVIGTAGLYSFATIAVVGACAYLGALVSGGSIAGTVTDPQGSVIAGATVLLLD